MKKSHLLACCAPLAALLAAGCGHLDFAAPGDPSRVLVGSVSFSAPAMLPDDAEILVRVMNPHPQPAGIGATQPGQAPLLNQPVTATAAAVASAEPEELAEQTIKHATVSPVPFKIAYEADDEVLRRGLSIEVRISYGGRVQLFNSNQYSVTLADVTDQHPIEADAMR